MTSLSALSRIHVTVTGARGRVGLDLVGTPQPGQFVVWNAERKVQGASGTGADAGLRTDLAAANGGSLVGFQQAGEGAVARSAGAKARESVSVMDFGAKGDGVTDDRAAFQRAIDTGRDVYVPSLEYSISGPLIPRVKNVGQTLYGDGNATIRGAFDGFLFRGVGEANTLISSVTQPIVPLTWTITVSNPAGLAPGDPILLYDVVADEYEVNRVQTIISNTIYCTWPTAQPFATPANVRLYKMKTIQGFVIRGLRLTNTHPTGGGLVSMTYTENCSVEDCQLGPCGYIGVTFQSSLWPQVRRNAGRKIGASGVGFRVVKAGTISDNAFVDTQTDESVTLYKNVTHCNIFHNRIAQYLNGSGGGAGNGILLDQRCYFNTIAGNQVEGSATYAIYLYASSSYNTITHNTLNRVNLGGIKVQNTSQGNIIDNNVVLNVTDATDPFENGPTAAIRVTADCIENTIGVSNLVSSYAGAAVIDAQAVAGRGFISNLGVGTASPYQKLDVRGGSMGITTRDFDLLKMGSALSLSFGAQTGNTFAQVNAGTMGDNAGGHIAVQRFGGSVAVGRTSPLSGGLFEVNGGIVSSAAVANTPLAVNGDTRFRKVSNTSILIEMRGDDGVTRSASLTLA